MRGIWFQISSQGSHHDVHTHGNCSWSGVYCLQVDAPEKRIADTNLGAANGVTRFYGPYFNRLGGAAMDFGNAYLQNAHLDIDPVPGQLVIFPSWLALPSNALSRKTRSSDCVIQCECACRNWLRPATRL